MTKYTMTNNTTPTDQKGRDQPSHASTERKPNETGGIYYTTHIVISDPNTGEVLLKKRGDQ